MPKRGALATRARPDYSPLPMDLSYSPEEEAFRTFDRGDYYVIRPMLPELTASEKSGEPIGREYSSSDNVMTKEQVSELLVSHKLTIGDRFVYEEDMLA